MRGKRRGERKRERRGEKKGEGKKRKGERKKNQSSTAGLEPTTFYATANCLWLPPGGT